VSSSKKTETSTQTATPTNPQWVTDGSQAFSDKASGLLGQDPSQFFAGPQGLNTSLFGLAGGLGQQGAGYLGQAGSLLGQFTGAPANTAGAASYNPAQMTSAQIGPTALAQGQTAYGGINNYLNPASAIVAGNTISELDRARQLATNNNGDGALLAGQYGGSRQGVLDANTNRDFYTTLGNTLGNLNLQNFNTALGASQTDADRAQQAVLANQSAINTQNIDQAQLGQQANASNQAADNQAGQYNAGNAQQNSQFNAGQQDTALNRLLAGSGQYGALGQYGLGLLGTAGGTQQDLAQNQAGAPITTLSALSGDYSGLPLGLFNGKNVTGTGTTTTNGSLLDTGGKILQAGSNIAQMVAMSDVRTKRDVETAGYDARGRRWVDYNYHWDGPDEPKRRGVIAQEVAASDPEAVMMHPSGFLMVDYSKLEG
jgi:hypothetical protein